MSGRAVDLPGAAVVGAVSLVLALPFLTGVVPLDEGALVHVADRIAGGEVLYRDVATGIMPGSYYLHALLFLVFGRSLLVGRVLMIGLFSAAAVAVYALSRSVSARGVALPVALAFAALTVDHWRYPNYSPQAMACVLAALAAALAWMRSRQPFWLPVAGLALGAALLFKQNYGAFAALAIAAGLLADAVPMRRRLGAVARVAAAAALPPLVAAGCFATAGALGPFVRDTVLLPFRLSTTLFARPYPSLQMTPDAAVADQLVEYLPFQQLGSLASRWLHAHLAFSWVAVLILFYGPLLVLMGAAARLLRRWRAPGDRPGRAVGVLLLAASAFLFLGVFPRVDTHHLVMILAPSFVLVAWIAGPQPGAWLTAVLGSMAGLLLVVAALSQAAAAHLFDGGLVRPDLEWVALPRARVFLDPEQARTVEAVVEEVGRRVPPGEPLFVAPAMPLYSFLCDRPSPTRFPLILPGALDEAEVVRALDKRAVRFALVADDAFDGFSFAEVAPVVWDHLHAGFGPTAGLPWERLPRGPYLRERGAPEGEGLERPPVLLRHDAPPAPGAGDGAPWHDLMQAPGSAPPPFSIVSSGPFSDVQPRRVAWKLAYLQPALRTLAPWGWRKLVLAWDVPVAPGARFEFACAVGPTYWNDARQAQDGATVEVWVLPEAEGASPERAWIRRLDPLRRVDDRRWLRASVDLASFSAASRARVILVAGPAATFRGGGAGVVWTRLRTTAVPGARPARAVDLAEAIARAVLPFAPSDLPSFQESAAVHAELPVAHAALADVAGSLEAFDLALAARRRAAALAPSSALHRVRLAEALEGVGELPEALATMRAAVELEPGDVGHRAALAALLLRAGHDDEARAEIATVLQRQPDHAWALGLRAMLERQAGNPEAALAAARAAVAIDPASARSRLELFEALDALGRAADARAALDGMAALDLNAGTRALVARRYLRLGAAGEAADQARAATRDDSGSFAAWAALGDAAAAAEDAAGSLDAWRRAASLQPGMFEAQVGLGRALAAAGLTDGALQALRAAALVADKPPELRQLALVYDTIGRPDEAASAWEQLLEMAPDGPFAAEARRHLGGVAP